MSDPFEDDPFGAVAALFAKDLGVTAVAAPSGYRGTAEAPLEGEWLGAYSEARMLEVFSPMRVVFSGDHASSEDDMGKCEWRLISRTERDLEWRKKNALVERTMRARKLPNALVGVWTTPANPSLTGCFWLVPASRLSTKHAAKIRLAAKRRFWPAGGAQLFSFALIAAAIPTIAVTPWWLFPLPFAIVWYALKDALAVPAAAEAIRRELDAPLRARIADDEHHEDHEEVEEDDEENDEDDEAGR